MSLHSNLPKSVYCSTRGIESCVLSIYTLRRESVPPLGLYYAGAKSVVDNGSPKVLASGDVGVAYLYGGEYFWSELIVVIGIGEYRKARFTVKRAG